MRVMKRVNELKKLWIAAMPQECPLPDEYDMIRWSQEFVWDDAEQAILKAAKKMRANLRNNIPLVPKAAQRYTTSILLNERKMKADRRRTQELLRQICVEYFTGDDVDFNVEPLGEDYYRLRSWRNRFKESVTALVEAMVTNGATDEEIRERVLDMSQIAFADFDSVVLPVLQEGQQRLFFTPEQLGKFFASVEHDRILVEHDTVVRLGMDGRFAVDIIAKSDEVSDKVRRES